jgi:hypothetical protein
MICNQIGHQDHSFNSFKVEIEVDDARVNLHISTQIEPADALGMVRKRMGVAEDVRLGYRLPGDPKKAPAHLLESSENMREAMTKLLGKMRRARSRERREELFMAVEILVGHSFISCVYARLFDRGPKQRLELSCPPNQNVFLSTSLREKRRMQ